MNNKTAVAILSFNRPYYFKQVLESIRSQTKFDDYRYFLFQDGAVNKFSGIRYAEDKDIIECVELAKQYIPDIKIYDYSFNLGVYLNYYRAEKELFENLGYERIYFFEDDLVLNKNYFEILEYMMDNCNNTNVVVVNAIGYSPKIPLDEQIKNSKKVIINSGHFWGYGLYRDKWRLRQEYMKWYDEIMNSIDYRQRPSSIIREGYKKLGFKGEATSQDGAKEAAYLAAGLIRIGTFTVNARYIGETGLHSTSTIFKNIGWDDPNIYNGEFEGLEFPEEIVKGGNNILFNNGKV